MSESIPDFSPLAEAYARSRPRYPAALFEHLSAQVERHELAWDCATGSGQAAFGLARRFERVVATDVSAEQIRHALAHPKVDYRVAPAEASGLEAQSVDVVTVGAAVHWFDPDRFAREVRRVVRPGGLLAAFTYHVGVVEPPFDEPFRALYWELLKPYFAPLTRLVDERYETLPLPGVPVPAPRFEVTAKWTLAEALEFVGTWSGAAEYRKATGDDAAERIRPELARLWPEPARKLTLRWPLFLRVQRLP